MPTVHYVYLVLSWSSILLYLVLVLTILTRRNRFGGTFYTLTVAQVSHEPSQLSSCFWKYSAMNRAFLTDSESPQSVPEILLLLHIQVILKPRKFGLFQLFSQQVHSPLAA